MAPHRVIIIGLTVNISRARSIRSWHSVFRIRHQTTHNNMCRTICGILVYRHFCLRRLPENKGTQTRQPATNVNPTADYCSAGTTWPPRLETGLVAHHSAYTVYTRREDAWSAGGMACKHKRTYPCLRSTQRPGNGVAAVSPDLIKFNFRLSPNSALSKGKQRTD